MTPGESPVPAGRAPRSDSPTAPVPRRGSPAPAGRAPRFDSAGAGDLAARQAALVGALVAGEPDPPGFVAGHLAVARRALLRKRAGAAAAAWPRLAASLGPDWFALFAASVADRPPAGALVEGWDLARTLRRRGELGDAAAVELAEREVTLRRTPAGHAHRRLPAARRASGRLVVRVGRRIVHLPLTRS